MTVRVIRHRLDDGHELHVECYGDFSGKRQVMVLIPGWAYTAAVFENNIPVLGRHYDVLAFDPRGHGRSSPCRTGHSYEQHGEDLRHLLQSLQINRFVLLGWSLGVYDALCYLQQFGSESVSALIAVDESPRIVQLHENDWGEGDAEAVAGLVATVRSPSYLSFFSDYMLAGFKKAPAPELVERFCAYAATLRADDAADLLLDATRYDFTALYRKLDQQIPVLQLVRDDWARPAEAWCAEHTANAQFVSFGEHLMLFEFPEQFNQQVLGCLSQH
jgi:pimeloyl-ACP methyl ester carboxylesterase